MEFKLTEQALEYLNEIEEALTLRHACECNHNELQATITKLKLPDKTENPEVAINRILAILGKYSRIDISGHIDTADAFYELFHKLFNLSIKCNVIEK